ncbi:MAG: selenium cofactor biosynthesis protein YqeC [Anaerolineales bacterium]|jgi:molybdenum cofactor cytidylyltransferase
MNLSKAIRLSNSVCLALTGAGGKTTGLFQLAHELSSRGEPVIVTATTHLHVDQIKLADSHWVAKISDDLAGFEKDLHGVMLVTGPREGDRTIGVNPDVMSRLREFHESCHLPLLIEADGSRRRPLKAPAEYEPVTPEFVDKVLVFAGLTGLGKPLTNEYVHRPEIFARLSGLNEGDVITPEALVRVLTHPLGGLKNIPPGAKCVALLNQADTPVLQAQAKMIAGQLLPGYQAVIAASLNPPSNLPGLQSKIHAVYEPVAGIILAGGGSTRFGRPKQLLDWQGKPFIRVVAETALTAGIAPVWIVTGAHAEQVENALNGLDVGIVYNRDWQTGQSSSIQTGMRALAQAPARAFSHIDKELAGAWEGIGAAFFLLADQPQVTPPILHALVEEHSRTLAPIVAPMVAGQRANPVLFDRTTFPELMALSGDVGGRAIFSKVNVNYLTWHDEDLLADVDTTDDYRKLVNRE